jgi:aspartate-semialdehyde dehydrogenase
MVPASGWGDAAVQELSAQVIALFNQGTPPRKVFEHGLAFDLLPEVGMPDEEGWTDRERRAAAELDRLTGADRRARVTLVGVPVFSGISAHIHLHTEQQLDVVLVQQILKDGGVGLPKQTGSRYLPRPRRVDGQPFAQVGRIRKDPLGDGLHMWVSMDNLRVTAGSAVAASGAFLRRLGLLD